MSYQRSNSCAFCHDHGHHISKCQVLANTECRKCGGRGHTTTRCKNPSQNRAPQNRAPQNRAPQRQYRRRVSKIITGQDGWSTVRASNPNRLSTVRAANPNRLSTVRAAPNPNGWATIVKASVSKPAKEVTAPKKWPNIKTNQKKMIVKPNVTILKKLPMLKKNFEKGERWADMCDVWDQENCPWKLEEECEYVFGK